MLKKLSLTIVAFLIFVVPAEGAMFYFDSAETSYSQGDIFLMKVRVDNERECLNAFDVRVGYDNDILRAVDFGVGDSIISLWMEEPDTDQGSGIISFVGGVPGGYCGRVSGDPGIANVLGTIVFSVTSEPDNEARVWFFEDSAATVADGLGTYADLRLRDAVIAIEDREGPVVDEWSGSVHLDETPPEPFEIQLVSDPGLDRGEYYIIFRTTDKQSGIDFYEVKESDERGFVRGTNREAQWRKATSPYKLMDQSLQSIIQVRAVNKAGLRTVATLHPDDVSIDKGVYKHVPFVAVALLILVSLIWFLARRRDQSES